MDTILEKATAQSYSADILSANTIDDIATIITDLFSVDSAKKPTFNSIEYITQQLFKGKKLGTAVNEFIKKFKDQNNLFLGESQSFDYDILYQAVLNDKAKTTVENAIKMKDGMGFMSLSGNATKFNIDERELAVAVSQVTDGENKNGVLKNYPDLVKEKKPSLTFPAPGSDYENRVRGVKTRERVNEMARQILETVDDSEDLTEDQRQILAQYSGKGGLTENSQDQYYTPPELAKGVWDALKVHGFENGNVGESSCGNGIFLGTKPEGVKVSANDIDPTAAKIARLLNPTDDVKEAPFEEIAASTPDNHFDAFVGNIPFGQARGKSKHKDPAYKDEPRIDRYFILRILDKLKPGGLCCLIVPTVIVGKKTRQWEIFRADCSKKAEFLGAHKLPNGAFSKGETGTDTVVDIVVFQKHPESLLEKIDDYKIEDLKAANVIWDEFVTGRYWQGEGAKYVHGTIIPALDGVRGSRERVDGDIDNAALRAKLAARFTSRIDWNLLGTAAPIVRNYAEGDRRIINGQQHEFSGGQWVAINEVSSERTIDLNRFGLSSVEDIESLTDVTALNISYANAVELSTAYTGTLIPEMRDALAFADAQKDEYREQAYRGTLIGSRIVKIMNGEEIDEEYLEKTRQLVAAEYEKYGKPGKKIALSGSRSSGFGLFANAMDNDGNFSELLKNGKIDTKESKYDSTSIWSIVNYLSVRMDQGPIDFEIVKALYSGELNSLGDLAYNDEIAITPDGFISPVNQYCSGEIYPKIANLSAAIEAEKDQRLKTKWQEQIDLMLSKATYTAPDKITFSFQHKWFKPEYIVDFLSETDEFPEIDYDEATQIFSVNKYDKASGFALAFEKYLNGSKMSVSGGNAIKNEIKRQEYAERLKDLNDRFTVWMLQHEDADEIVSEYNRKFNGYVPFEHSEAPLGIDEYLSGEIDNHTYQNQEVRRLAEIGSGICGFEPGLGKSYVALGLVAFNHKKGQTKRTCLVVPDAVLENFYHEARSFYNTDFFKKSVKFVGLKPVTDKKGLIQTIPLNDSNGNQRTGKNGNPMFQDVVRTAKSVNEIFMDMWEIPQSEFVLVVMTKEKFKDIPVKEETRGAYVDEMVDMHLMTDGAAEKEKEKGKNISYDEAVKLTKLEGKYSAAKEKGELPFFEDMGFDNVIYDECHFFKNSVEPGKVARGTVFIPTASVAAIAREMAVKSHFIRKQNGGRGVVGLSATPVTNSPFEIFNQLLQVADISVFHNMGIHGPDDFIRVFGNIQQVQKEKLTGEVVSQDGLAGFQNLDGLRGLFNRFCSVKDANDVGAVVHIPEPVEKRISVMMDDEQNDLYEELRAEGKAAMENMKDDPGAIFRILRNMERVATDTDMYHKRMTFTFPVKYEDNIKQLVDSLPKKVTIEAEDNEKETETEKIEVSAKVSVNKSGDKIVVQVPDAFEDIVMKSLEKFGIEKLDICHPLTTKYAQLIANCKRHLEQNGKQIIFTEEKSQHNKIVRILLMHLPINEKNIAIINASEAKGAKLDKISKAYNGGDVKIIVANRKAEVGVNLQRGTTAIHHLTLPWTPASIGQKNGRGVRQGNHVDFVDIYYYLAQSAPDPLTGDRRGSADDMRLNTLMAKAKWIDELLNSTDSTFLNPDANDDAAVFTDIFSSNPEEAARKRKERKEEERRKTLEAIKQKMRFELGKFAKESAEYSTIDQRKDARKAALTTDIEKYANLLPTAKQFAKDNPDNEEAKKQVSKIQYQLKSLNNTLENLDGDFQKRKEKLEKSLKQSKSVLMQNGRSGTLPFDEQLVENPDCVVSLNGVVYGKNKYIEIPTNTYSKNKYTVCKVVDTDAYRGNVILEYIAGARPTTDVDVDGKTWYAVNKIKGSRNVDYTESDISMMKALSSEIEYRNIANIVTEEIFNNIKGDIKLRLPSYKAYREESGKIRYSNYTTKTAGLIYPSLSESFAKELVKSWLASNEDYDRTAIIDIIGEERFKKAWEDSVSKGSDDEITSVLSKKWADLNRWPDDPTTALYYLSTYSNLAIKDALKTFPNTEGVKRVSDTFFDAIKTKLEIQNVEFKAEKARLNEERQRQEEAARVELEKLAEEEKQRKLAEVKADPNFKEIPEDFVSRLREIGITAKINTVSVDYLTGINGTSKAFGRLFMCDEKGYPGPLRPSVQGNKKAGKKGYAGATYTDKWREHSGSWWHMDIKELEKLGGYNTLAERIEDNA